MITTADLKTQTRRDLVELARQLGVTGWHSMRKEDLIAELSRVQKNQRRKATSKAPAKTADALQSPSSSSSKTSSSSNKPAANVKSAKPLPEKETRTNRISAKSRLVPVKPPLPAAPSAEAVASQRIARILAQRNEQSMRDKDLSSSVLVHGNSARKSAPSGSDAGSDRIALIVRDSFWLQATWEVTQAVVQRAAAAMAEQWHTARPILRVYRVSDGAGANATDQWLRDIPIHGGVNTWYIDVDKPGDRYRVVIGYLADSGRLFSIARSNLVETPQPGACDMIEGHWKDIAEDYERIYALSGGSQAGGDLKAIFEDRLQRTMHDNVFGAGADVALRRERDLPFTVDAELIVFGKTLPGSSVSLAGEPVRLQPDGSFTVRVELPDRRQVLPIVASSRDGIRQRTTVIAVERNTKVMESIVVDEDE